MVSLATALTHSNATYAGDLVYGKGINPRMNESTLEVGGPVQTMKNVDEATFGIFKERMKQGLWPNLKVVHDPIEGFVVEAAGHINDWTLIAEYTGEVGRLQTHLHDASDSIMDLLVTGDDRTSLTINASKMGGIARFLSGINNNVKGARKKLNCRSVRFSVGGQTRVLLITIRDVKKGERLYYDYNGHQSNYPTEHFI